MLVFVSCLLSFTLVSQSLYNDVCIDNDISIAGGNSALMYGILPCNDIANNLKDLNTAEEVISVGFKESYLTYTHTGGPQLHVFIHRRSVQHYELPSVLFQYHVQLQSKYCAKCY